VVDDVIIAKLDLGALGDLARLGVGADVEADDRRSAGACQRDVALGDRADARVQDPDLDLVGREPVERVTIASTEPWTSALTTSGNSLVVDAWVANMFSR
jgi:hypothetical protein